MLPRLPGSRCDGHHMELSVASRPAAAIAGAAERERCVSSQLEPCFAAGVVLRTTTEEYMRKSDLLAHAAECERALQVATEAEHRDVLQRLRAVWLGLAREHSLARDPQMQEEIAALRHLHEQVAAVQPTLH
jgi:hypothetical protein